LAIILALLAHRDLKPPNIMVTESGRVKVLDFGLARIGGGEATSGSQLPTDFRTREGVVMGTLPYMSPEQVQGHAVDHRSDLFSLGTIVYEMACGRRPFAHQRSPATLRLAIQCFEQAIEKDPRYALAYAGLADCHGILSAYGLVSPDAGRPPSHAAMTQAAALAPTLWEVRFSRAFRLLYFERDWPGAELHFQRAIEVNPRSSLAQGYYGIFLAFQATGKQRTEEAVAHMTLACELDPLSPFVHGLTALGLFMLGRSTAGERTARRALELQADYMLALWARGVSLLSLGRAKRRASRHALARTVVGGLAGTGLRAGRPRRGRRPLAERAGGPGRARRLRARLHAPGHPGRPPRRSGDPHGARAGARGVDRCLEHPGDDRGVPGGVPLRSRDRPDAEGALPRMTSSGDDDTPDWRLPDPLGLGEFLAPACVWRELASASRVEAGER
jgi:tetratricopeptide (TPR) repeat protein